MACGSGGCRVNMDWKDIVALSFIVVCILGAAAGAMYGFVSGYGPIIVIILGLVMVVSFIVFTLEDPALCIISGALFVFFSMLLAVDVLMGLPITGGA